MATECGKRADAYLATHGIMRGAKFAETELTTVLDEQDSAHAVWISDGVIGKLTIKDRSEFAGRYASNGQLGDAIAGGIGDQCSREGGVPEQVWAETWFEGSDRDVAVRGLSCWPQAGAPSHHAVLVTSTGVRFHIFALLTNGKDPEATRVAARHMALAIGEAP